jgi:protein-tyrosine phosphatase
VRGITALLSLTEEPLDASNVTVEGFDYSHMPIADMTAPTPSQLRAALTIIEDAHRSGSVPNPWIGTQHGVA